MDGPTDFKATMDRVATDCIAVRVRLLNRVISALYDEAMRPFGLRISQGNLLVAIAQGERVRPVELSRRLRIEKSTLSRDVELMKRHGWLETDPPTGGRNQVLRVTPDGQRLLEAVLPAWELAQGRARELLGAAGIAELDRITRRLSLDRPHE